MFSFVEKADDESKKETNDLLGVGDKRPLGDRRRLEDVSENLEAQEIPKKDRMEEKKRRGNLGGR